MVKNSVIVTTTGVPQAPVLASFLWNILYYSIFEQTMTERVMVIGFANDRTLLVTEEKTTTIVGTLMPNVRPESNSRKILINRVVILTILHGASR